MLKERTTVHMDTTELRIEGIPAKRGNFTTFLAPFFAGSHLILYIDYRLVLI